MFGLAVSRRSTDAAVRMTEIERRREHSEMRPQFTLSAQERTDLLAELRVELTGPLALDRLDRIELFLRDDHPRTASQLTNGPTAEQVAGHVWGPYRFRPGVDGADHETGRYVAEFALPLGEGRPFALDRQSPPSWNTGGSMESWRQEYAGQPVRLTARCYLDGYEPWVIPLEVHVKPLPAGPATVRATTVARRLP